MTTTPTEKAVTSDTSLRETGQTEINQSSAQDNAWLDEIFAMYENELCH